MTKNDKYVTTVEATDAMRKLYDDINSYSKIIRSDEQATCKRNEAEENEKKAKIEKLEGELKKGLREVCLEFNIITDKERKSMIASAMLRMNYSLKRTAEYTGLSLSEVKRLKEELQDL